MGSIVRGEIVFFCPMKKRFEKDAKTPAQLVELLKSRGLFIAEEDRAERYLMSIGYYRLSAYFSPFQEPKDQFINGASFDDILDLYIFDRKLRLHVLDALERIEELQFVRSYLIRYVRCMALIGMRTRKSSMKNSQKIKMKAIVIFLIKSRRNQKKMS
jgi:abortive infection bacteriophage resistance protein